MIGIFSICQFNQNTFFPEKIDNNLSYCITYRISVEEITSIALVWLTGSASSRSRLGHIVGL